MNGEVMEKHEVEAAGFVWRGNATETSSHELLEAKDLPDEFTWGDARGGVRPDARRGGPPSSRPRRHTSY